MPERPLRLLFLNHNLKNDGTYFRALPMAQALSERGHQVTVMTVCRERVLTTRWSESEGVRLGETPNLRPNFGATGYGLLDILARCLHSCSQTYDLIHMFDHKPNTTLPGFLARALRRIPVVCDWADWWGGSPGSLNDRPHRFPIVHRWEDWWEVRSKLWSDGVTTISRVLQQRALDHGYPNDQLLYIPTGAPLRRIQPVPRQEARQRLGLDPSANLLGFVGISQEDLEILFETLQREPECQLLLIGPVLRKVQQQARELGVSERVLMPGRIHGPALNDYLGATDLLCLPMKDNAYNRGRLPNKLLDYLAAGRAVVAGPVGDVADILNQGGGVLAGPEDFPRAVADLLDHPERARELGTQARSLAEAQFDWSRLIVSLERFYRCLLARRSSDI